MIDNPQIVQLAARPVAVIRMLVPRENIQNEMGPAVRELYAAIAAQGIPPAGPWFTHHFRRPGDTFDFEAGVPVGSQITPVGRVQAAVWPAMKVARTVYSGGYEGLGAAWATSSNGRKRSNSRPRPNSGRSTPPGRRVAPTRRNGVPNSICR